MRPARYHQQSLAPVFLALLFGAGCGILVGFGVTFLSWIGIDPASCCPVNPADPISGAALGAAAALWAKVMRLRYEADDDDGLRIRSRKRRW